MFDMGNTFNARKRTKKTSILHFSFSARSPRLPLPTKNSEMHRRGKNSLRFGRLPLCFSFIPTIHTTLLSLQCNVLLPSSRSSVSLWSDHCCCCCTFNPISTFCVSFHFSLFIFLSISSVKMYKFASFRVFVAVVVAAVFVCQRSPFRSVLDSRFSSVFFVFCTEKDELNCARFVRRGRGP